MELELEGFLVFVRSMTCSLKNKEFSTKEQVSLTKEFKDICSQIQSMETEAG